MRYSLHKLLVLPLLMAAVSCLREEPQEQGQGLVRKEMNISLAEVAPFAFQNGDSLCVLTTEGKSKMYAGTPETFVGEVNGRGPYAVVFPYRRASSYDGSCLLAEIPVSQKAERDGFDRSAVLYSAFVSTLDEACILEPRSGLLRFSVTRPGVEMVSISTISGESLAGSVSINANTVSSSRSLLVVRPLNGIVFECGEYYACAAPFTAAGGVQLNALFADGSAAENTIEGPVTMKAGQTLILGAADERSSQGGPKLLIELKFKKDELLNDNTVSGSAWPFDQPRGTASELETGNSFTVTEGGFPIRYTGASYYLNSKTGARFNLNNGSDYLEFPAIYGSRISRLTYIAGGNGSRPYLTDCSGTVISGGEMPDGSLAACKPYTWTLSGNPKGEAVRLVFGSSAVSVMYIGLEYECDRFVESSDLVSVSATDARNENPDAGTVRLSCSVDAPSGGNLVCGFEYRKAFVENNYTIVECPSGVFSWDLQLEDGVRYEYRSWACRPNSWKCYSKPVSVESGSILLDFCNSSAEPFTKDLPKETNSSSSSSTSWSVRENTSWNVAFFVPSGVRFGKREDGCLVVGSSGNAIPSYIGLPSLDGKKLSRIILNCSEVPDGGTAILCNGTTTDNPVSLPVTLIAGKAIDICAAPIKGRPKGNYLLLPSSGNYVIESIIACYDSLDGDGFVEEADDTSPDYQGGVFNYSSLKGMGHPRLFMTDADFADLFTKLNGNDPSYEALRKLNNLIMRRADEYYSAPLPQYKFDAAGLRILTQARIAMKQLVFSAYAYRMTGNEKYLYKAKDVFAVVCAFPDWNNKHFLDTSELTFGVAVAYDWLYDVLSLGERTLIHRRIVDNALQASLSQGFHASAGNWNQVCNGGMMAGAITLYEKDHNICASVIEKGVASNKAMAIQIYSPDGNYAEGYTYWDYGNFYQVAILKMLDTAFGDMAGIQAVDGLLKTARFMQFMNGVTGPFSYSDGGSDISISSPAMWWYAAYMKDASLLSNELRCLDSGIEPSDTRALPVMMSYAKDIAVPGSVPAPSSDIWTGAGVAPVAIVHTGWKFDADDHYLGIKAGRASAGHGHMDAGSFVYDALGCRWSADVADHDYASMEVAVAAAGASIWDVFLKTNLCHSCLSVMDYAGKKGRLHPSDFVLDGFANIVSVFDNGSEKGAEIDMTPVYEGQLAYARRKIVLRDNRDLIVTDEIEALPSMDAPVQWRMLTPASVSIDSGSISLNQQGQTMYLKAVSSSGLPLTYVNLDAVRPSGWVNGDFDISLAKYRIAGYTLTVPAGTHTILETSISPIKP